MLLLNVENLMNRPVIIRIPAKSGIRQLNESTNSRYFLDIDWYLNNGYSKAEDVFDRIENGYNQMK